MPNYNSLILTGADWKVWVVLSTGQSFPLNTIESISMDVDIEEELIYAVGDENAIGNKQNARRCSGKLSAQAGEILSLLALTGIPDATRITDATVVCAAVRGGFVKLLRGANFNTDNTDISRKSKETLTAINITALANI